jgi:hypothetical protein
MTLGPILRHGHRVRYTPRNRTDNEWPSRWAEAMLRRGTIMRTMMTRAGVTKVVVQWDGVAAAVALDPDVLDYVVAVDENISVAGMRVRRLPSREVGKTSAICDWAGAVGVIVTPVKDAYVRVRWPCGNEQRLSVFAIEPE